MQASPSAVSRVYWTFMHTKQFPCHCTTVSVFLLTYMLSFSCDFKQN